MKKKLSTGIMGVIASVASFAICSNESTELNDYLDNHEDESKFIKVVNVIGITFKYVAAVMGTLMLLASIFNNTVKDSEK